MSPLWQAAQVALSQTGRARCVVFAMADSVFETYLVLARRIFANQAYQVRQVVGGQRAMDCAVELA